MAKREPEWGIVPFEEWLEQKPRSPSEIEVYHRTIEGLTNLGSVVDGKVVGPMARRLTRRLTRESAAERREAKGR